MVTGTIPLRRKGYDFYDFILLQFLRQASCIKRPIFNTNQIYANFTLDKLPKNPMLLEIIGQDDDKPGSAKWELILNGKMLAKGDNPFVAGDWNAYSIKFPASYLKLGKNNISIVNITPEQKTTRTKGLYDRTGAYIGETKDLDETYGWIAINRIRLCIMRPLHFISGKNYSRSSLIYIDPDKKYKVSALVKGSGKFNFRIILSDALGKELSVPRISYVDESLTELYAPCNKGDKFILVKNASKWKTGGYRVSFSPVPKPAVAISDNIKKISQEEHAWKIELAKPLSFAYPAGAKVACGKPGINGLIKHLNLSKEWTPIEFIFSSEELLKERPGAKFFAVLLQGKDLSVKDINVEEIK